MYLKKSSSIGTTMDISNKPSEFIPPDPATSIQSQCTFEYPDKDSEVTQQPNTASPELHNTNI